MRASPTFIDILEAKIGRDLRAEFDAEPGAQAGAYTSRMTLRRLHTPIEFSLSPLNGRDAAQLGKILSKAH